MRGAASSAFIGLNDYSQLVTLKIWWKTGSVFQETFSIDRSTFADVKYAAIRYFGGKNPSDPLLTYSRSSCTQPMTSRTSNVNKTTFIDFNDYKLISIESKRVMDEKKTLSEGRVKNEEEYLLALKQTREVQRNSEVCEIDERVIELRTENLADVTFSLSHDYRLGEQTEFRTDLNNILMSLIETSQKLLWYHPDAENIFKQAEEILLQPLTDDQHSLAVSSDERETRRDLIGKLLEMGFTEKQSQIALRRNKNDLHAAMELLLVQSDLVDDDDDSNENTQNSSREISSTLSTPRLFTRDGPFIPFRQYQQQRFRPNSRAVRALQDMGFSEEDIIEALKYFGNDQNLACEYLLSDRQQQTTNDANNDHGLDPNSPLFQSIIQNPIVLRALNNPKTFFVMLKISENPSSITNYLNDPDIGNMFLQISRIYHVERDRAITMNHRTTNEFQQLSLSRTTGNVNVNLDHESD